MRRLIMALALLWICIFTTYAFAEGIDAYTVLLLHGNGDDGSTNFIDDSPSNHPVTVYGDAQVDTAQSKFGGASILFDGSGDYLTISDSADWDLGAGDFTIDFWIRFNSLSGTSHFIGQWIGNDALISDSFLLVYEPFAAQPRFLCYISSGTNYANLPFNYFISVNTWYHVALVRSGNSLILSVNGVSQGVHDISDWTLYNTATDLLIGIGDNIHFGNYCPFDGWLDEVRISKGIARWTSNFTPPTEEYGAIPNDSPIADAGPDLTANAGEEITLDGSYSNDPDGDIISWVWRSLSDPQAPIVAEGEIAAMTAHGYVEELIELTVTDNNGATATDTMKITNTIVEDAQEIPQLQNEITQLQNQLETQQGVIDQLKQFPALENWMNR